MIDWILFLSLIGILLLSLVQSNYMTRYKDGYIFATSVPFDFIEDGRVGEIIEVFKKGRGFLLLILFLLSLLIFFMDSILWKVMLFILICILYMVGYLFILNRAMKDIRTYKKIVGAGSSVKYVDLRTSVEIEKDGPGPFLYILPYLIILPAFFFLDYSKFMDIRMVSLITIIGMNTILVFFAKTIQESANIIYSSDSKKNIELNIRNKTRISRIILIVTSLLSLIGLVSAIFLYRDTFNYIFFIIYFIVYLIFVGIIVYWQYRSPRDGEVNLNVEKEDYFDIIGYKNPEDKRLFVPSRLSPGNFEINRARPLAKVIFALLIILVLGSIVAMPYLLTPSNFEYRIEDMDLFIKSKIYKDEIDLEDIREVKLLDKFPEGRVLRENGTSLPSQSYGNFTIEGLGKVRLYYYKSSSKLILIEADDKTYIFNEKDDGETEELYRKIEDLVKGK